MLYVYRCIKCGNYWCCSAAPEQEFEAVNKWCPYCIPIVTVQMQLPRPKTRLIRT